MSDSGSESDYIFAGISIFPVGVEGYHICISLVSSTGSCIENISFSSPSERAALDKTLISITASHNLDKRKIKPYFSSVPPAFPPDRQYDVFKALRWVGVVLEVPLYPLVPLNHAEAFAASMLPKGEAVSLLALDFYSPPQLYVARLLSRTKENGKRVSTVTQELSLTLAHVNANSLQGVLDEIKRSLHPSGTDNINLKSPDQIMLIKPLIVPDGPGGPGVDIGAIVAELHPNVPVSIVSSTDIAHAAASFAYTNSILPVPRLRFGVVCRGRQHMALPVSVATTSGAAICATRLTVIPNTYHIILTNSVNNQKSATVRLMLGNHTQTKDNIQRAVVVLDGLTPLPKGEARIKVSVKVLIGNGWEKAVRVGVVQKGGPKKKFLFPRFFGFGDLDLPGDYRERYEVPVKEEDEEQVYTWSDIVGGELPE